MKIVEELKALGVEITADIEKKFGGEFISVQEHEKKLSKIEAERDSYKSQYETAEETLKGFEGKDFDAMQKEVDSWKQKAEDLKSEYETKEAEREKADLLKEAFSTIKFTSEAAKKSVMAQIADGVTVKGGKLIGFNDLLEDAKQTDADAFVSDAETKKAVFTQKQNSNSAPGADANMEKLRSIMGLKTDTE